MKILLTGGGTGGHFYPLIAVAQELNALAKEYRLLEAKLYYMAPIPYNNKALFENNIEYRHMSAGKARRYFSLLNVVDVFKTIFGIITAILDLYSIYPDVVFGKGGYVSFPVLLAARLLRIPVVIHESDTVPGRVNMWAGKFATRIAISYPDAAKYFPQDKVAYTCNPVRKEIMLPARKGSKEFLGLEENIPTILVLGGSLGSRIVNEYIMDALVKLLPHYQVIHQTGPNNFKAVQEIAGVILKNNEFAKHYKPYDYLNDLNMRMAAGAADLVISRAGSAIFEIAAWNIPSIIIPISDSQGDHQRQNAYAYARTGAATVIEEANLSSNIIVSEVEHLMKNSEQREKMALAAKAFFKPDAARKIATEIMNIALSHEE